MADELFPMLKILAAVLLLTPCLVAQEAVCPELEILGPQWITMRAKEPTTFVLRSGRDEPESFRYIWSVENGTIASGQGTRVIDVTTLEYGAKVRVTVTVIGFPSGCPNSASMTIGVEDKPAWHLYDEWGQMPNDDQRGRLDSLFFELANDPAKIGLILIYGNSIQDQRRRLKLVLDHARFRKFDQKRLVFCHDTWTETSTKVYIFHPAFLAEFPYPDCTPFAGDLLLKQIASRK